MSDVRCRIIMSSGQALARAVVISTRYSLIRRQGAVGIDGGMNEIQSNIIPERQVMDYPTQQAILIPLLAWSFAMHAVGRSVCYMYRKYMKSQDLGLLSELHAITSALKITLTQKTINGIETCRQVQYN